MTTIDRLPRLNIHTIWKLCRENTATGEIKYSSFTLRFNYKPEELILQLRWNYLGEEYIQEVPLVRKYSNIKKLATTSYLVIKTTEGWASKLYYSSTNCRWYPRITFLNVRYNNQLESPSSRTIRNYHRANNALKDLPKYAKVYYRGKPTRKYIKQVHLDEKKEEYNQIVDQKLYNLIARKLTKIKK